jgi:hypothetical protein
MVVFYLVQCVKSSDESPSTTATVQSKVACT